MATKKGVDLQFSISTKEANENLKQLSSQVITLNKTLGISDETLKGTGKSVETYNNKIQTLNSTKDLLIKKQEEFQKMFDKAVSLYGENSKEATKWGNALLDNEKAIVKVTNAIDKTESEMDNYIKSSKDAVDSNEELEDSVYDLNDGYTTMKNVMANLVTDGIRKAVDATKDFAKNMITTAATIKAETSQFEQTFGEFGDDAEEAINRVADSTGVLNTRLKITGSQIYAFAMSNGATSKEAMALMEEALMAVADSAAYYDRSLEDTADTLKSFLKGNFANDAALGVSATEFTRNAKAVELFGKKYNDLTEMQKQQTLLKMVTDSQKLSGAMGQAARESDGFENVVGNLKETWRQFQGQVGAPFLESLIPIIQQLTKDFQKWQKSVDWKKFGKDVQNAMGKLIDIFSWIVRNNKLVISGIGGIVAAMGTQKVLNFVDSLSALKEKMLLSATATQGLNAAMSATPTGLVLTAIGAITGSLVTYISTRKQEKSITDEISDSLKDYKVSLEQADTARQEYLDNNMGELGYYEDLYRELQLISDANGLIKEGYEERAKVITTTLADALGIEIDIVEGQISKYDELKQSIDDLIASKRAQYLIDANEEIYNVAMDERIKRQEDYNKAVNETNIKYEEALPTFEKLQKQFKLTDEELQEFIEKGTINLSHISIMTNNMSDLKDKAFDYRNELSELNIAQENAGQAYISNENIIYNYQTALGALQTKNYDVVSSIYEDSTNYLGKTYEETLANYEKGIQDQQNYLTYLKQNKDKYNDDFLNSEKLRVMSEIDILTKEREDIIKERDNQNQVSNEKTLEGINAQLQILKDHQYKFKETSTGNMQLYVDGIESGNSISRETMKKLVNGTIQQIKDKKMDAKEAGEYLIEGVNLGIRNKNKQSSVFNSVSLFGASILSTLKGSLKEHSPSKASEEMAEFFIQGFDVGIDKEKADSLKNIASFGKSVLDTFSNIVKDVNNGFESMKFDNVITPQFTQEVTQNAMSVKETRPVILNIDTFNNNTDKDIEKISNELAYFIRQKEVTG